MVKVGDNAATADSFVCRGADLGYATRTGKRCCRASNIRQDNLPTWFKAEASSSSIVAGVATVLLRLFVRNVFNERVRWKALRWDELGLIHSRRVHVSVASTDLRHAWHVHPDESLPAAATELPVKLRLPAGDDSDLTVRLHVSFGVRGWAPSIAFCIDSEDVVHIDPGPNQEMMVEGEALTNLVTLQRGGAGELPIADLGAWRSVVPLRLGGYGGEEVADFAPISRSLEAPCAASASSGSSSSGTGISAGSSPGSSCWSAHMVAGTLSTAAFATLGADVRSGHHLDAVLYANDAADASSTMLNQLTAPACVGLSLVLRRPDGQPAARDVHAYLTMGAHAIVAKAGTLDAMWHVHFSPPEAFSHTRGSGQSCAASLPGYDLT
jgi:hypothetical protein